MNVTDLLADAAEKVNLAAAELRLVIWDTFPERDPEELFADTRY